MMSHTAVTVQASSGSQWEDTSAHSFKIIVLSISSWMHY